MDNRQRWIFDRIDIDQVTIDATIKKIRIIGGLIFYEDSDPYGKGFRGILKMDIKTLKAEVDAVAQFGRHYDGFKYFFVDALVSLDEGIGVGTFKILGLGGGLYYRMSRDTADLLPIPSFPTGLPLLGDMGVGLSGIQYVPDSTRGIGFKANVVFASEGNQDAFNGNASFEIAFHRNSGIDEIRFEGNIRFMSEVDFAELTTYQKEPIGPPPSMIEIPLCGYVRILYDFDNSILDGDISVFLNTPMLSGAGLNGRMAWAKLYFSEHQWYVNIGKPSNPCKIVFEIPGIGAIGEVTAYINIGNGIEPMPPIPEIVQSIAGKFRPNPVRGRGKGFAFGASFKINTGEKKFLFLTASLDAGAGFDVLLQNYGDATCHHSGEKPGINGWYASGQVYAYLEGKVGIKVGGNIYPVLELGVAAALQGSMPNPIWLEGAFGVRYNVLGGFVKGNCKFRFQIGQECEMISAEGDSSILDYDIIDHISPYNKENEFPTDGSIEVFCNYPIDTIFYNGIDETEYRIKVNSLKLLWHENELPVNMSFEDGRFLIKANCTYYLPERDTIYFIVKLDIMENNEVMESESDTIWFVTGDRPDFIPVSNVKTSYPMSGQYNFYAQDLEEEKGYLYLNLGQPYLFTDADKPDLLLIVSPSGESVELDYTYEWLDNKIEFKLPSSLLTPGGLYKLAFIKQDDPDQDAQEFQSVGINLPGLQSAPTIPSFIALPGTENLSLSDKNVLLQWVFRVSIFETFKAKILYDTSPSGEYAPPEDLIPDINMQTPELLSFYDIDGIGNSGVFKSGIALKANFGWFKTSKLEKMYSQWTGTGNEGMFGQYTGIFKPEREFGYPPIDAVEIQSNANQSIEVLESDFLKGTIYTSNMQQMYCTSYALMKKDWEYLQNRLNAYVIEHEIDLSEAHSGTTEELVDYILKNDFPHFVGPDNQFAWSYKLPAVGTISSITVNVQGL